VKSVEVGSVKLTDDVRMPFCSWLFAVPAGNPIHGVVVGIGIDRLPGNAIAPICPACEILDPAALAAERPPPRIDLVPPAEHTFGRHTLFYLVGPIPAPAVGAPARLDVDRRHTNSGCADYRAVRRNGDVRSAAAALRAREQFWNVSSLHTPPRKHEMVKISS
jgi:hypothetical protein